MFRNYSGLWLLLSAALVIMLVVAFSDDITVGDYTLKKAPVADMLLKSDVASEVADSVALDSVRNAAKEVVTVTDSLPQSLFIFGDSMTYNLALRLAQYAKQNGHSIHAVNWDSSNTKIWADCDTLSNMIRRFRPTHVFIALGSNELYFKDPKMRLPHIRKILEMIDTVPYTWIGPLTGRRIPVLTMSLNRFASLVASSVPPVCTLTERPTISTPHALLQPCGWTAS